MSKPTRFPHGSDVLLVHGQALRPVPLPPHVPDLFARLSSRPHPLDELIAGAALEQSVGHPVDAIGAR